jgi:hypothetical protein
MVIDDRRYDGRTVRERLELDGLLGDYDEAVRSGDASQVQQVFQQVLITPAWARVLAASVLGEPPQLPIRLDTADPRNAGLLRSHNELKFPPCMRPFECPRDPFMNLGSHPDVVDHLWRDLNAVLPSDCRCVVFGTPGLVAPGSGIALARAFGTRYIVRIPPAAVPEALRSGAEVEVSWAGRKTTDLRQDYGEDWVFGNWINQIPGWLRETYAALEQNA